MTDYLVAAAIAAGIAIGIIVCGFLTVLILYSWSMLVSYLADKCDASINKYRDKVSRRRAERDEINRPDPKPEESAPEKHEPHLDEPFFRYGINPFGLGSYFDAGRRDYEWFYLGGKQDD